MLPAWQGAGRLPSSLQKETKTELTPASPAKVSKQMHCELWDLHSLSCLSLFACPAPFLHGNRPLKKKNQNFICYYLHSDFGFTKRVTESTNQHLQAQVPIAGFLTLCCAELSWAINPHQTIFSSDVSYLSSILHALGQPFSFWYFQSLPSVSHIEILWV